MSAFRYRAEQADGTSVTGTIDAVDTGSAERKLQRLELRVLELSPDALPARPIRLGPNDLRTFNEFLIQNSKAGVPVERGLALLAGELRKSKLKSAIDALVSDLDAGQPIEQAIANRRGSFPPLYGNLIDAGIRSGDLPAVLQQFGRHSDDMTALRDSLWRALAYPAVVLVALLLLLCFLGYWLLPSYFTLLEKLRFTGYDAFGKGWRHFQFSLPPVAYGVYYLGKAAPVLLILFFATLLTTAFAMRRVQSGHGNRVWIDRVVMPLPLVGRAVRDSYVASWLDVVSIGAGAGLDLPRALRLASDAVDLPSLSRDAQTLINQIEHGRPTAGLTLARIPATVPLAIDIAQANLRPSIAALAEQYRLQAERQIRLIPGRVLPPLLIVIALIAGFILYSLWMPLAQVINSLLGN